jgi:hypothetical protein
MRSPNPRVQRTRCHPVYRGVATLLFLLVSAWGCNDRKPSTPLTKDAKAKRTAMATVAPQLIEKWIVTLEGWQRKGYGNPFAPPIVRIDDERIARVLPTYLFYAVHVQEWPVAQGMPPPLTGRDLFAIGPDQKLAHLPNPRALEALFKRTIAWPPIAVDKQLLEKNKARSRDVVYAWLRLSQEFSQDGMFQFSIPEDSIRVDLIRGGYASSGRAVVLPRAGNLGEISAILVFDGRGTIDSVSECRNVLQGERPVCQATKLLDPDPTVRRMAARSLLVMGRAAESYVVMQRTKASPELKREIDRVWAQIVAEGR